MSILNGQEVIHINIVSYRWVISKSLFKNNLIASFRQTVEPVIFTAVVEGRSFLGFFQLYFMYCSSIP